MLGALGSFEETIKDGEVIPPTDEVPQTQLTVVPRDGCPVPGDTKAVIADTDVVIGDTSMGSMFDEPEEASVPTKRSPTGSAGESLNTSHSAVFTISKITKRHGRPKMRKHQKVAEKKSRTSREKKRETKSVQETLTPGT
ncbi:hypothetical protein GN244_ATG15981 [Phytophthora infestans]|uniref:Uncharacterized protein n=1 Tax=Phytophthora infestans TaxID=4787 RepID=A0A833W7V8_PHYIN|nr:hypothetical protein GN244_ATG15981 [Phytophthora infestans]